jgi:ERCC4-type nuclease
MLTGHFLLLFPPIKCPEFNAYKETKSSRRHLQMTTVKVSIDIREDELIKAMSAYTTVGDEGWYIVSERLDIGDIAFQIETGDLSGVKVVLERKTAADLGASQKDGRYREQRARLYSLRGSGIVIGYIVEAPAWSPTLSRAWCLGAFNEVHLQQAIVRLQFRHSIPVFHTMCINDTISYIRRIAKLLVADPTVFQSVAAKTTAEAAAAYTAEIHVKKAENNTPERILYAMLMAIPGVGKTAADGMLAACGGSLTTLIGKTVEELALIPLGKRKLGTALATTIYSIFHS